MLRYTLFVTFIVQFLCLVLCFQSSAAGKCVGPPLTGLCRAAFPKWFYNVSANACQRFIYGGCGGNDNRFDSRELCEMECIRQQTTAAPLDRVDGSKPRPTTPSRSSFDNSNKTPPANKDDRGAVKTFSGGRAAVIIGSRVNLACKLNTTKNISWVHYPRNSRKVKDVFDVKRFKTMVNVSNGQNNLTISRVQLSDGGRYECLEQQTTNKGILFNLEVYPVASSKEACSGEPVKGSCQKIILRWFYNATAGECMRFVFSGCGGNGNSYETRPDCESMCLGRPESPASESVVNNSRELNRPRLKKPSKSAMVNDGDFEMVNDQPSRERGPECRGPAVTGPCRGAMQMWFYNEEESACQRFTYGGCRGSRNRHRDRQQCERRCLRKK